MAKRRHVVYGLCNERLIYLTFYVSNFYVSNFYVSNFAG